LIHEDNKIITPMIDSTLESVKDPEVSVFIDSSAPEGWELRAAWDKSRLDLKHGAKFEKIALYENGKWQKYASKIAAWFVSGEVKFFDSADAAHTWLKT